MPDIQLPDLEKLEKLIQEINTISLEVAKLTVNIKLAEADIVREVTSNSIYFQNGKPPSMAFIEATYLYTGIENSLVENRKSLAEMTAMLDAKKTLLKFYQTVIDIWRTMEATNRASIN